MLYGSSPEAASSLITRRRFIAAVGSAGLAAWAGGCTSAGDTETLDSVTSLSTAFSEPEVLSSRDGLLEVTLRAAPTDLPWAGSTRHAYTYNGTSPGPTLRIEPGDRLVIHLENGLDDDTNLHTHGLHVSPSGDSDNVFVSIAPGSSRTYVYDIPADHRSGLFWYHPHAHGNVAQQVAAGLAGAIVVVDGIDQLPELVSSIERIWIIADPPIGATGAVLGVSPMEVMQGRQSETILVNGIERPNIVTAAGVLERWRIVNASSSRYYRLALDDHLFHVMAGDGGRLAAPVAVEEVLLAPGERTELLVTPVANGSFALRSKEYDRGSAGMGGNMMGGAAAATEAVTVAIISVTGQAEPAPLPASLVDAADFDVPRPDSSRVVELGEAMGAMTGAGQMMSFTIDGRAFDPNRTDITTALGAVEEWEIRNPTHMDHPFHLHVWPFLVVDSPTSPGWKDTVNVPARQSVRIVIPFDGIAGRTVYHCHILDHEDHAMMGVIDVTL